MSRPRTTARQRRRERRAEGRKYAQREVGGPPVAFFVPLDSDLSAFPFLPEPSRP